VIGWGWSRPTPTPRPAPGGAFSFRGYSASLILAATRSPRAFADMSLLGMSNPHMWPQLQRNSARVAPCPGSTELSRISFPQFLHITSPQLNMVASLFSRRKHLARRQGAGCSKLHRFGCHQAISFWWTGSAGGSGWKRLADRRDLVFRQEAPLVRTVRPLQSAAHIRAAIP